MDDRRKKLKDLLNGGFCIKAIDKLDGDNAEIAQETLESALSRRSMSRTDLENSKVTQEFNRAFTFIAEKAKAVNKEDDDVDANMKQLLLGFLSEQKQ
jgi:putative protein kinase ArgK-like GTPase of G3E family